MTPRERIQVWAARYSAYIEGAEGAEAGLVKVIEDAVAEERETARARFFVTYPWWLYRMEGVTVPEDVVDTLLELAKNDRREDFFFMAGSAGVPPDNRDQLWEGTRRRLGL